MDFPAFAYRPIVKSGMEIPLATEFAKYRAHLFCGTDGLVFLIENMKSK